MHSPHPQKSGQASNDADQAHNVRVKVAEVGRESLFSTDGVTKHLSETQQEARIVLDSGTSGNRQQCQSSAVLALRDMNEPVPVVKVFNGVYGQLKNYASLRGDTNAKVLLSKIRKGAEQRVLPIQQQGLTSLDVFEELSSKMEQRMNKMTSGQRENVQITFDRMKAWVNHFVRNGEVDPLTAKVFLRALPDMPEISKLLYNAMIKAPQEAAAPKVVGNNKVKFWRVVQEMWNACPEPKKHLQKSSDGEDAFYHFDPDAAPNPTDRIYISAKLWEDPTQVLTAWNQAVEAAGLQGKVYFKVPAYLDDRADTIIAYFNGNARQEDLRKLLDAFEARCPSDLLAQDMPTAIKLRHGVFAAPQGVELESMIGCFRKDNQLSYSQLISVLGELAMELSYNDAVQHGIAHPTPRQLKDPAEKYFGQLVKLSLLKLDQNVDAKHSSVSSPGSDQELKLSL